MKNVAISTILIMISFCLYGQINVGSNFKITSQIPIDSRFVFTDTTSRNALSINYRYQGLLTYTINDSTYWSLVGGLRNSNWKTFGAGVPKIYVIVSQDDENDWTVGCKLTENTMILYNGVPLTPAQWIGIGGSILSVDIETKKYDYILITN